MIEFLDNIQIAAAKGKSNDDMDKINMCSYLISEIINSNEAMEIDDDEDIEASISKDIDQTETSVPAINQYIDEIRTNKVGDQPYAEAPQILPILIRILWKTKDEKPVKKFLPALVSMLLSNRNKKTLKKGGLGKIVATEAGKKVGESGADKLTKKDKS